MQYECLSVVAERFDDGKRRDVDRIIACFGDDLARAAFMFRFQLADIRVVQHLGCEPHPAVSLVRALRKRSFESRLLLAPQVVVSTDRMRRLVDESIREGAGRVILNVDSADTVPLPSECIRAFTAVCARHGVRSEIRVEFDAKLPESVLNLISGVENARFYTSTIPVQKKPYRYETRLAPALSVVGRKRRFRVLILKEGDVCLRERGDTIIDTYIGNLKGRSLVQILGAVSIEIKEAARELQDVSV